MGEYADEYVDNMMGLGKRMGRRRKTMLEYAPLPDCNQCGAVCYWHQTTEGWRLYQNGKRHVCKLDTSAVLDEFDND